MLHQNNAEVALDKRQGIIWQAIEALKKVEQPQGEPNGVDMEKRQGIIWQAIEALEKMDQPQGETQ